MQVSYIQCDLCKGRIEDFTDALNIKYKARRLIPRYFSIEDAKEKLPISTEWKEIDICEHCIREIINRRYEKDKE